MSDREVVSIPPQQGRSAVRKLGVLMPVSVEQGLTLAQNALTWAIVDRLPEDELERRRAAVDEWERLLAESLAARGVDR